MCASLTARRALQVKDDFAAVGGVPGKTGLVLTAGQPVGTGLSAKAAKELGLNEGTAVGSGVTHLSVGDEVLAGLRCLLKPFSLIPWNSDLPDTHPSVSALAHFSTIRDCILESPCHTEEIGFHEMLLHQPEVKTENIVRQERQRIVQIGDGTGL